jgi:AcrR family transcriptional regulator
MPIIVNKEEKVKEICLKAYNQFIENGIESFSLNKFVATTDISKGQFYHYFKTKDELVFEVMSHKTLEWIGLYDSYLNNADTLLEKLFILFSLYINHDAESKQIRRLLFDCFHIYIHSKDIKVREYNKNIYKWTDDKLIEIFQKEDSDIVSNDFIHSISATADGMYLRSLMVDNYDLKSELTKYLIQIVQTIEKG